MKRLFILLAVALMGTAVSAQVRVSAADSSGAEAAEIYTVVEDEPEFPGGMEALYRYLGANIKYPTEAKAQKIQGLVYVSFVIEKDGTVTNIKLLRDIGGGCGQEAVRVVSQMPKWKPGRTQGRRVRTQFNLPINFNLN